MSCRHLLEKDVCFFTTDLTEAWERSAVADVAVDPACVDGGIDAVRERLQVDDEGRPGLLVADYCTPLIQEFLGYQEDHVGKDGADDHALDALRYGVFTNSVRSDDRDRGGGFARSF